MREPGESACHPGLPPRMQAWHATRGRAAGPGPTPGRSLLEGVPDLLPGFLQAAPLDLVALALSLLLAVTDTLDGTLREPAPEFLNLVLGRAHRRPVDDH